jgi:hypothetical protein
MYQQTSIAQPRPLARTAGAETGLARFGRALLRRARKAGRLVLFGLQESRRREAARQIAKYRFLIDRRSGDGP